MSWLKKHSLPSLVTPRTESENKSDESNSSDTESIHSNDPASNQGYGTDDTLAVTRILEEHGIPCCLVGIAALVFYGASRVRDVGHLQELCFLKHLHTAANMSISLSRTGKSVFQQNLWAKQQSCYNLNHMQQSIAWSSRFLITKPSL